MCIITWIPANVDIPWEGIHNGSIANDDGHGWAVAKGDTLLIGKSMDPVEAMEGFEQAHKNVGPGAVSFFHSRIATAGTLDTFNVHPFYVGKGEHTVMAHNGILDRQWQPSIKDIRSDTRKYADAAAHLVDNDRGVPSRRVAKRIGREIGYYNKFVFLSVKSGQPAGRIINAEEGVFRDGVWYSNYSYMAPRVVERWRYVGESAGRYTPLPTCETSRFREREPVHCQVCHYGEIDYGYCIDCQSCEDCYEDMANCLCYTPASARTLIEDEPPWWREETDTPAASPLVVTIDTEMRDRWSERVQAALAKNDVDGAAAVLAERKAPLQILPRESTV